MAAFVFHLYSPAFVFPMLLCSIFVLLLAHLVSSASLLQRWGSFAEKHAWVEIPQGWELQSEAPSDYTFNLYIGLKQGKVNDLIANLMEVSDPSHARYGQHLSKEEVEELVRPRPESTEAVEAWLEAHGLSSSDITGRTGGNDGITVRVSVSQAERMLGTKYYVFRHAQTDEQVVRTTSYSLPRELHSHIDVVAPTTYFGTLRSMRLSGFSQPVIASAVGPPDSTMNTNGTISPSCQTSITPACLRALYNTENYVPTETSRNSLGVAGYLNQYASRADLQIFLQKFRPDAVGSNLTVVQVNGGGDDQNEPDQEANLDVQYATAMSFPTPNTFWSTGGSPPFEPDSVWTSNENEPYLDWINFVLAQKSIPPVITTSYADNEQTVPFDYANRVCNLFAQLGSRGVTALFASGDYGVGASNCRANDGTNRTLFQPLFPPSCPFVTAVGATTEFNPEVAATLSGGGFSRYFVTPSYQSSAVKAFIKGLGKTHDGLYKFVSFIVFERTS
jgi:tripeptidyl-peptidase-1